MYPFLQLPYASRVMALPNNTDVFIVNLKWFFSFFQLEGKRCTAFSHTWFPQEKEEGKRTRKRDRKKKRRHSDRSLDSLLNTASMCNWIMTIQAQELWSRSWLFSMSSEQTLMTKYHHPKTQIIICSVPKSSHKFLGLVLKCQTRNVYLRLW